MNHCLDTDIKCAQQNCLSMFTPGTKVSHTLLSASSVLLILTFMQRHLSEHDNTHAHNRVCHQRRVSVVSHISVTVCKDKAVSYHALSFRFLTAQLPSPKTTRLNYSQRQFRGDFCG